MKCRPYRLFRNIFTAHEHSAINTERTGIMSQRSSMSRRKSVRRQTGFRKGFPSLTPKERGGGTRQRTTNEGVRAHRKGASAQRLPRGRGQIGRLSELDTDRLIAARKAARIASGLTLRQLARRVRISSRYLAQCERQGAPYGLALRLSSVLDCNITLYL